jgi:DNA-directed RNA polymerase specialized sigma subunit
VKIALNLKQNDADNPEADREKAIERDADACRRNDWEAKTRLIHTFMPLLTSLAKKRATETADINRYIEAGKDGLVAATRHYKQGASGKFQVFALNYIENEMERLSRPGFFARLFGRS